MIESVKQSGYEKYSINYAPSNRTIYEKNEQKLFDIQEILKHISDYTYTEDDMENTNAHLVEQLEKKFDIKKEDVYKLQHAGFNLEQLYINDYADYESYKASKREIEDKEQSAAKERQIKKLEDKINVVKEENTDMYLYALTEKKSITINSLYEGNYKGSFKKNNKSYTDGDLQSLLQMNGLVNSESNQWAAKMLVESGMEVNKESIVRLQNIKAAIHSLDVTEEAKKAQEDLEEGKTVGDRELIGQEGRKYDASDIKKIKEDLGAVTEQDIEGLLREGKEVTITNLREMMHRNTEIALGGKVSTASVNAPQEVESPSEVLPAQEVDTANHEVKDQINQIRTKLTVEAAQKISEQMPLESTKLSEIAKELAQMEEATVEEALKNAELPITETNKEIIKEVIQTKTYIASNKDVVLDSQIATKEEVTLNELRSAFIAYEENETLPEARFGEGLKTVEGQIESILASQGIEVSEVTVQAAKALISNGLDVTAESLEEVMQITLKVNTFLEEMTPYQTAVLLKEGLNPLNASINTILEWVSEEKVEVLSQSIAESIVALEDEGSLNAEQKESLLGFYRIVQAVNNNREEVIGYLFKNELSLTMDKLQEATKYIHKKSHKEFVIDDQFGEVIERNEGQTAKRMLEENRAQMLKTLEVTQLLEDMELDITDENITRLQKINAFLYPYIKEQFKKEIGKFDGMKTLPQSFIDKLDYIKSVNPETIKNMTEQNIPITVSNIYWMDQLEKNPSLYAELLGEKGLLKEEIPDKLEEIEESLRKVLRKAKEEKNEALDAGEILSYKGYKKLEEVAGLQRELIDKEGVYQIPFIIDGETRLVNLYVKKDAHKKKTDDSDLKAVITYETKHIGTVTAYLQMKDETIGYKIEGQTKEDTKVLEEQKTLLEELISSLGYSVRYSEFDIREEEQVANKLSAPIKRGDSIFEEMI